MPLRTEWSRSARPSGVDCAAPEAPVTAVAGCGGVGVKVNPLAPNHRGRRCEAAMVAVSEPKELVMNANPASAAIAEPGADLAPSVPQLDHERLDVYAVALELASTVPELTRAARLSLRDQIERASTSIVLNIAEGCGRRSRRDRLHFFAMAQGSALECAAAIDILRLRGHVSLGDVSRTKNKIARVVQMLAKLTRG